MKHTQTKALYGYWNRLRGSRDAPERAELDPGSIRDQLADLFILNVEDRARFAYRLAGTRLCSALGGEMRGQDFLEPWSLEDRAALSTLLWSVMDEGAAAVCGWQGETARGDGLAFEMLLMPLRLDGDRGRRVLGSSAPFDTPSWLGVHPVEAAELTSVRLIWPDGAPLFVVGSAASTPVRVRHLAVIEGGRR